MPGISDSPQVAVNTAPIAAIGSEQPATPAVKDFMDAFRSGFITVDDLTRRTKQSAIDTSNLRTTISANDLTRQKTAAELQLLPGQQAEAATQQQIAATTAPVRLGMAQEQADKFARYQADPQKFVADESDRQVEATYIQAAGRLPETLFTKSTEKPIPFDEWLNLRNTANADAGLTFSGEVSDDPRTLKAEYDAYVDSMAMVPVKKGSPEYAKALRKEVNTLAEKALIQGARAKALEKIIENQAGGGKPPRTDPTKRINPSTGAEEEVLIRTDPVTGEVLGETVIATGAPRLTEVQANTQLFAGRMGENDKVLVALEQKGFDPSALATTAQKFLLPNRLRSEELQRYTAASENWISAVLRKESGAAITPTEYAHARQEYFPRDGDSPTVVRQKQELRKFAENQMLKAGGPLGQIVPVTGTATPAAGAAAPSAGTKRVIQNGVTFEWNGTTYVPIQ